MYPAVTVLSALKIDPGDILWVGGEGGMEKALVERLNIPFKTIPAAGVHGVGIKKLPGNFFKLLKGYWASRSILKEFDPDVLLFTGGYVAIPMALAGRKIPTALYVPDTEPGLALKVLSKLANKIAVTTKESKMFFRNQEKIKVTGYPVRQELKEWTKESGRAYFGLEPNQPVLLFMGGSSGARSINMALLSILPELVKDFQILHISGYLDWDTVQKETETIGPRYHGFPYLHEMGAALSAADLVISRAGASVLGEYPAFGLPAILVPYPYAWRYQKKNADFLIANKAAVLVEDEEMSKKLMPTIYKIMNNQILFLSMQQAMASLYHPDAAEAIATMVHDLIEVY